MAVMTSPQQSTPTLVEQKAAVKMATIPDAKREEENGVNGHVSLSPNGVKPAGAEAPPPTKATSPTAPEDAPDSATEAQKGDTIASDPPAEESANPATESAPSGASDEKDKQATEPRDEPPAPAAKPDEPPKDAIPPEEGRDSEMADAPIDQPSADTSADKPASNQASPGRDVDATPAADPAPTAAPAESTAETAAEPKPQPPSLSDLAIESQKSAETADINMADADAPLSSSSKVSRERDEDPSDEPAAKRARTEPTEAEIEAEAPPKPEADAQASVETEPAPAPQADITSMKAEPDPMEVDDAGFGLDLIPPYPDAEPGNLMHPGADHLPIQEVSVRAIKTVLSGVKKTKAGANFKDSVAALWPTLAESYSAKVTNPMDISLMERKLRASAYATLGDFKADVKLLVTNSVAFNGAIHGVTESAVSVVENIWDRMHKAKVEEPFKTHKKDKSANIRHTERSAAAHQPRPKPTPTPAYVAPTVPAVSASPTPAPSKPAVDKALSSKAGEGSTLARRDSTKDDDRPKRPIHPPKKDLAYEAKGSKKKKLSPELRFCEDVLKELMKPKHQAINWPFLNPVDEVRDGAHGYFTMITDPMDLGTIQTKLNTGKYANAEGFRHDFNLMLDNCFIFNPAGTEVNNVGKNLQSWFNGKWVDINTYVAKASAKGPRRPSASSPGAGAKDGSDDEAPSEAEAELEAVETKEEIELKKALEALRSKLEVTKKELTECLLQEATDMAQIDIHHSIIKMLTEGVKEKEAKLKELGGNRQAAKTKSAPTKPKKSSASAASANASSAPKKPLGGASRKSGGGGGSNSSKKSGAKRPLTDVEKQAIANGINDLDEPYITTAIDIIMKDNPKNKENGDGELELEIDALSLEALHKLYDLMCKGIKGFRSKVEAKIKEETQVSAPPALNQPAAQKPRKNKPMGKGEQELKIEHLAKLKSQFRGGRQGSGSQEPPTSNEMASTAEPAQADDDSDVSSEED
ncbi:hypothetical protein RB600_006874 [Gaeumannomyces tritici]